MGLLALAAFAAFVSTPTLARSQDAMVQDYTIYCAKCHGTTGHGDGPSTSLNTKPPDFTDCATMRKMPDDTIFKAIEEGGAAVNRSNDMPPFGLVFGSGGGVLYVTNTGAGSISAIDTERDIVIATIKVATAPEGIASSDRSRPPAQTRRCFRRCAGD